MSERDTDRPDRIDRLIRDWNRERPDLDADAMHLVGRLIVIGRALEARTARALRGCDLNYSDFDVLATLRRSGQPFELTPKELMESVLLTSGAMTALLTRLTSRGLITRGGSTADGRIRTARLTATGIALADEAASIRFDDARRAADLLPPATRDEALSLLRRLSLYFANDEHE